MVRRLPIVAAAAALVLTAPLALVRAEVASNQEAGTAALSDRLALTALVQSLRAGLGATDSATLFLEDWCGRYGLAPTAKIVARRVPGEVPLTEAQRQELEITDTAEPVVYRRVQLVCGDQVLSEADNWYLPNRLTPEINATLTGTDTPFGRAIRPLGPSRRTLSSTVLWQALPEGWERMPSAQLAGWAAAASAPAYDPAAALFENRAIVLRRDGKPISEVRETYKMPLIAFRFR
jgi:chorismate-pyruvate lyase